MRNFLKKRQHILLFSLVLGVFILAPSQALANGFELRYQSAKGLGKAFVGGFAGFGDGSSVYMNPSALAQFEDYKVTVGAIYVNANADFTDEGSSLAPALGPIPLAGSDGGDGGNEAIAPHVWLVAPLQDKITFGVGIHAPYGLATEYPDDWKGRYQAIKSELKVLNIVPGISYEIDDNFSVGASVSAMYADIKVTNAVDFGTIGLGLLGPATAAPLGLLPQAADGAFSFDGDDWGFGYTIGATYRYGKEKRSRVGIAYRSKVDFDFDGDAKFTVPTAALPLTATGAFTDSGGRFPTKTPEAAGIAFEHWVNDSFAVSGEAAWTAWDRFSQLIIHFDNGAPDAVVDQNWNPTWRFGLGFEYIPVDGLSLSTGYLYDQDPIGDVNRRTPRLPDVDRHLVTIGASYEVNDSLNVRAAYGRIFAPSGDAETTGVAGEVLKGEWDNNIDSFALAVEYQLG